MDPHIYQEMVEQENTHWWFTARRAITSALLKTLNLPANARILDAGCGSGGNLPLLSPMGDVHAFEMSDMMRQHAQARGIGHVESGMLPDAIPFNGTQFDLITLFDVLEHVKDDEAALRALAARLAPGGALCLTVPAYQWLFGRHDRQHHHFRRYSRRELLAKLKAAGLQVELANYWNMFLFPVALAARLLDGLRDGKEQALGTSMPAPAINRLLALLVACERFLIPHVPLPFGLSLIVLARKPA